jgi:hypothetical protein
MFSGFPKCRFEIIAPDGAVRSTVETIDGGSTLVVPDPNVVILPGDEMRRSLPNGTDETFEVIDPRFFDTTMGVGPHFQVKVRKKGTFPHHTGGNFNITVSGPNARVNVGSTDNSTNLVGSSAVFGDLQTAIETGISDEAAREMLIGVVREMRESQGTDGFVGAYQRFISAAANHMTIIAPFLPALTALLPS